MMRWLQVHYGESDTLIGRHLGMKNRGHHWEHYMKPAFSDGGFVYKFAAEPDIVVECPSLATSPRRLDCQT